MEYLKNKRTYLFPAYTTLKFWILSRICGFTIPVNVFGPGLKILHRGTIIINPRTKIGANCTINADVQIGPGQNGTAPVLGESVYIGPGVKIYGSITIGNNVTIGANAVVNKSFSDDVTIAGVPAVVVKHKTPVNE